MREHRLYQASFLLRDYGWNVEDLPFVGEGQLRLDIDPKRAWADEHLRPAPVDLAHARRDELLRVPGIGPVAAESIMNARKSTRLVELSQLRKLGIHAPDQVAAYILLDGRRPASQPKLF